MLVLRTNDAPNRDAISPLHWCYVGRLSAKGGDWEQAVRKEFVIRNGRGIDLWRQALRAWQDPIMRDMLALSEPVTLREIDRYLKDAAP